MPGAFASTREWHKLTPIERHRVRTLEALRRLRSSVIVSHFAAAAVWGIDVLGRWPDFLDVSQPPARGGRSSGGVRRHPAEVDGLDLVGADLHRITSPAQTALDLARVLPFTHAVAAIDQAIWSDRPRGALTTSDRICALLLRDPAGRGGARAARALAFADPLAPNVRESESRVLISRLGFPKPRLQERRVLRSGRLVFGDFYFPEHDHWAELDGRGKYLSPHFAGDRSADEIVIDEKNRENEIRREVRGFSRWEPADATPRRLYDVLSGDGLPSNIPRP